MNRDEALYLLNKTSTEYVAARAALERARTTIESSRLILQGIVRAFPDLPLEVDLDEVVDAADAPDRLRGSEAVLSILQVNENWWMTIPDLVSELDRQGLTPDSSNPPNAVRTAVERLVSTVGSNVYKSRNQQGTVVYRYAEPEEEEEPF